MRTGAPGGPARDKSVVGVWTPPDGGQRLGCYLRDCAYDLVTMEGRIKRLEREWDHPAHPGPDPETVAHWASLWIDAGMEEPRAMVLALEFLEYCQATGQALTFMALMAFAYEDDSGGGEDVDG